MTNRLLRDLNLEGDLQAERRTARAKKPERRLEVVVQGLPTCFGAQVAVDTTLVSPLRRNGTARPKAHWLDGAALQEAEKDKETTYPELLVSRRCILHRLIRGMSPPEFMMGAWLRLLGASLRKVSAALY